MSLRIVSLCLFLLMLTGIAVAGPADDTPPWLRQLATMPVPSYDNDVPAVVLRHEQTVSVGDDGKILISTVYAVRVLTREGRRYAEASESYLTKVGKVKELRAWLIPQNGKPKKYGNDQSIDQIRDPNDIYNEYRIKIIDASLDADVGSVFGYESSSEERPLFGQDLWPFQFRLPVLLSKYSLVLPTGWRASSVTFNHTPVEPAVSGSSYSWELRNLPPIRPEPASPEPRSLAPIVAITYFAPETGQSAKFGAAFEDWAQVSRWGSALHDPLAVPDESVSAKARELTASARTELDRIRAIGRFVQSLQYISIDIGVGKGNGYRPRPPAQVLAKSYGDCKDKANLMRAMLKAIDITAYPVAIYSGDPTWVQQQWASPLQFNHCIIAIKIAEETSVLSVIKHPTLGRLLIFDATDEHTPVGDLPDDEQGSLALIMAGDAGDLVRMPVLPPESSQLQREIQVELAVDGSINASLKEQSVGQTAVLERRYYRTLSVSEYRKMIESWITRGATGAKLSKLEPVDDKGEGRFALEANFTAAGYGQLMQTRLLIFRPAIVERRESLYLTSPQRQHPVVLEARAFAETVRVRLPAGFDVDELPDPLKLQADFGTYETKYEVSGGELIFTRSLSQRAATIPPNQYNGVRSFYERIRAAEMAPVVLARK